jgi:starch synthase (maltosyl-transferring)
VAIDLAFQCSPDHPYVKEHPEWFYHRSDGTIRYAENPPKRYQDIYPLFFENEHATALWEELLRVTLFWADKGVRQFRVDNPHTKPAHFWEWLIGGVKRKHPDAVFLAEAFTHPKPMKLLAKLGFSQSYTYFAWKNKKGELIELMNEFALSGAAEYYRGNLFTNTPDILTEYLQKGGRAAFQIRLVLAATLSPLYGIYNGYELCENRAAAPGSEEYLDSEKYQYKVWDWDRPGNIKDYIATVNLARKENPALQAERNLRILRADDENIVFYGRWTKDRSNIVLVAVNLDPSAAHDSTVFVPIEELGIKPSDPYTVRDLLTGAEFRWTGPANYVRLDPKVAPAHIFVVKR